MQTKVSHYLKYAAPIVPPAEGAEGPGRVPILLSGTNRTGEREYSFLETSKIQAACGLTDAQWETDLPEPVYQDARGGKDDGKGEGPTGGHLLTQRRLLPCSRSNQRDGRTSQGHQKHQPGLHQRHVLRMLTSRNLAVCDDWRVNGYGQQPAWDGRSVHNDQ
jgi:hypothetical protein